MAARVGNEIVMASEILVGVEQVMRENEGRAPQHELEKAKRMLMERNLKQVIETKLLYADARRTIPAEGFPQILDKLAVEFEKRQLPRLYEMTEATTQTELESRLKSMGTSIEQQKQIFTERTLAQQWLRQQIDYDVDVSHQEMVDYYRANENDYRFEATARWEELMVRFDRFPNRAEAYRAIAEMGNEVWRGRDFAEVAKRQSQGVSAARGGSYDWTTRGSLVFDAINRALFTLPTGQLSQVIETTKGFHIIRVIERRAAGKKPFVDAQVEIKERIKKDRVKEQIGAYIDTLREETKVWTMFDDAPSIEQAAQQPAPAEDDRYGLQ